MPSIAIDGPSGVGKSTLSRALAKKLGYIYIDTGAMYRTITLHALRHGIDPADESALTTALPGIDLAISYRDGELRVFLGGEDVSEEIRSERVTNTVSFPSAMPAVRSRLVDIQRDMAKNSNIVMDGRDIGTVVLPNADVKIFLTASAEERATRRLADFMAMGESVRYEDVLADIIRRDDLDSSREASPLRRADDAILVDSTPNTFEQTLELLYNLVRERGL